MRLSEQVGRRVAVWGAGRDGSAAARALAARNEIVLVADDPADERARALAGELGLTVDGPDPQLLATVDLIVRSPGVSKYRPEVEAAAAAGVPSTNLLALWLADQDPATILGVTGTKGKSTVSALCDVILRAHGRAVALGGNIGVPATELPAAGTYVIEVSSYQAADMTTSPRIGVLTSLAEDHLPWHGTADNYRRDKLNLFAWSDLRTLVVNGADDGAVAATASVPCRVTTGPPGWFHDAGWLWRGRQRLIELPPALRPRHLADDACVALAASEQFLDALDLDVAATAVAGYEGLPSRGMLVGVLAGVEFVDDALASNPLATVAALRAHDGRPLALILGGEDRTVDHSALVDQIARTPGLRVVVLISETGAQVASDLERHGVAILAVAGGVAAAVGPAMAAVAPAGVVLFSPAAPTPAGGGTWETRSQEFRAEFERIGR